MKKIVLASLLLALSPLFAHATQHIYVSGIASWYWNCGTYYYTDLDTIVADPCVAVQANGEVWAYVNGVDFSTYFDAGSYYTAASVAQNMATGISNYFGVTATVVVLDTEDNPYPHWARIDIDDSTVPIAIGDTGSDLINPAYTEPNPWRISASPIDGFV